MTSARGSFEVQMTPCEADLDRADTLARLLLTKTYEGELSGTAQGHMLTCTTATEGSAGYVAHEVVDGSLAGRSGTFVLQHSGLMNRQQASLQVDIVPDSGTGELTGIAGQLTISIADDGSHSYDLTYQLP